MPAYERLVVDTNVVLSGILFADSIPARALLKAQIGTILTSETTRLELVEVLGRSRFDRYVERDIRQRLVEEYINASVAVDIPYPIRACRDPHDDKFLEVAVHGHANLIVTGDQDLLALHPFHGIDLLTPAEYLRQQ
jgi:putative PIN family toxin of toxin-antitoxin system